MSADILGVQSDAVPVGQDQKQHVEVARDIAIKFNNTFGEVFKVPEPVIGGAAAVVPGLDGQKMSKSYHNTIDLFGDLKETKKRVMRIVTDSKTVDEPKDPDACNLFALYRLLASDAERDDLAARYRAGGVGYGEVKKMLFEKIASGFEPFRRRRGEFERDPGRVEDVLRAGAARARAELKKTLQMARQAIGLE